MISKASAVHVVSRVNVSAIRISGLTTKLSDSRRRATVKRVVRSTVALRRLSLSLVVRPLMRIALTFTLLTTCTALALEIIVSEVSEAKRTEMSAAVFSGTVTNVQHL